MPYFGYARQDRKPGPRTPISAKLVANLIERAGVDRVMTLDLHAGQIQGFFDIPTDNLFAAPVMVRDMQERYDLSNLVVVSPDVGGVVRARGLAKRINVPIAICDKRRERAGESEVMNVIGDVSGKCCVLIDDIVDSGGTLVNAANALLAEGATEVSAYITHGVLSGGAVDKITRSSLKTLVISDFDPADRGRQVRPQHPRPVDCPAAGRGDRPHVARRKRLQPVLLNRALAAPSPLQKAPPGLWAADPKHRVLAGQRTFPKVHAGQRSSLLETCSAAPEIARAGAFLMLEPADRSCYGSGPCSASGQRDALS